MSSLFGQIDEAKTVAEVVAIVRDHLATWTPEEIGRLPLACRPGRIRDEMDIADLHSRLVDEYRTTRASGDALTALQLLTSFLVRSSVRIAELGGDTRASTPATTEPKRSAGSSG
jgi:hypothetical protein